MGTIATMGISAGLCMSAQGLAVQRAAIEVAGNNIANVNTPNYSRQRVNMVTDLSVNSSIGPEGYGATITNIQQLRSILLDTQIPANLSDQSYYEERSNLLEQITSNLGQTVDNIESLAGSSATTTTDGLQESLDAFFNTFESLSANPTSQVLRQQVILNGQAVAGKLNTISNNLTTLQSQVITAANQNVTDINSGLANIASLNQQIYNLERGSLQKANNLRDTRQQAIEDLAKRVDINFQEQADGTVQVRLGNAAGPLLVDRFSSGNTTTTYWLSLAVQVAPNVRLWGSTNGGGPVLLGTQPTSGTLTAQLDTINTTIGSAANGGLIQQYDNIAWAFGGLVNRQHGLGYTLQNSPWYDQSGLPLYTNITSASTITFNPAVAANVDRIAASDTGGNQGLAVVGYPNNGNNALKIAQIRDDANTDTASWGAGARPIGYNTTVSQYYLSSLTNLGSTLRTNDNALNTQKAVNQQLTEQRDSVMGVSIDEEMTNLIRFQYAYEANAKVISSLDQMYMTLINMKQ
jgi:flagellar hook-associated protein 1 FlgK